jgi:hypothetical protein
VSALSLHLLAARPVATSCTGECQKSGPLGLLVILFKSLSRHLRNVRDHFPAELPPDPLSPKRPVATTLPAPTSAGAAAEPIAAGPDEPDGAGQSLTP